MAKTFANTKQREAGIDEIDDLEVLRARLKAAEVACVLFGWSAAPDRSRARGRMAYKAWSDWREIAGPENSGPATNRDLNAELRAGEKQDARFKRGD